MNTDAAARALEALDEIRGLLQAAEFAARKFEKLGVQHQVELSEHIHRTKKAADGMRARIQLSVRASIIGSRAAVVPNRTAG